MACQLRNGWEGGLSDGTESWFNNITKPMIHCRPTNHLATRCVITHVMDVADECIMGAALNSGGKV